MDIRTVLPLLTVSPLDIKQAELIEGEILRADVKDVLPDGKVKLSLKGFLIEARTEVSLKAGDVINAVVESSGDKIILKLTAPPETNKILESIRMLLPERQEIGKLIGKLILFSNDKDAVANQRVSNRAGDLLNKINDFLSRLIVEGSDIDENIVKNIVEKGGQFYETLVKKAAVSGSVKSEEALLRLAKDDLKPLVMNLIKELDHAKDLQKTALGLLRNIELNQFINNMQAKHDGTLYFQVPFYFKDNLETAELFFSGNRKGAGDKAKKDYGIIISLNMKGLGQVVADARVKAEDVSIRIYTEDEESAEFVRGYLDMLKNGIESKGMKIASIDCIVSRKPVSNKLFFRVSKIGLLDQFV